MASLQEVGFERRLSELALPGNEWQIPVKKHLEKLLLHTDVTWDDVTSLIRDLMGSNRSSTRKLFPWDEIVPKLTTRQKKRSKCVHGRLTYHVAEPPSRVTSCKRPVTSCPGRRCSRPVGSCWAGKGACLQDFHSNNRN